MLGHNNVETTMIYADVLNQVAVHLKAPPVPRTCSETENFMWI